MRKKSRSSQFNFLQRPSKLKSPLDHTTNLLIHFWIIEGFSLIKDIQKEETKGTLISKDAYKERDNKRKCCDKSMDIK